MLQGVVVIIEVSFTQRHPALLCFPIPFQKYRSDICSRNGRPDSLTVLLHLNHPELDGNCPSHNDRHPLQNMLSHTMNFFELPN